MQISKASFLVIENKQAWQKCDIFSLVSNVWIVMQI